METDNLTLLNIVIGLKSEIKKLNNKIDTEKIERNSLSNRFYNLRQEVLKLESDISVINEIKKVQKGILDIKNDLQYDRNIQRRRIF